MTTLGSEQAAGFTSALAAGGRSAEIPEADDLYGWLIGSWEFDVFDYDDNGGVRRSNGEVHFGWVLEGRVVQDVWIMPRRSERGGKLGRSGNRYGTTLRVWDPAVQAWRVTWINPVTGLRNELVARRDGANIVQVGTHPDGTPIRWIFSEIAADSFRWTGERLLADGKTWKLEDEFRGRRIQPNVCPEPSATPTVRR